MDKKSILIVEDEPSIAEVVSLYLQRAGFYTRHASDGKTAMTLVDEQFPELAIIDIMLPEIDGLSLTRWIRDRSNIPIILLTARREEADRIAGLEMGADDYVVKPFSPQELVSRVRAVLRRAGGEKGAEGDRTLQVGSLTIDPLSRSVLLNGASIELTVKEFDMLHLLLRH